MSGAYGNTPPPASNPTVAPGVAGGGGPAGWSGLQGVLSFLAGGPQMGGYANALNDTVYQQLLAGHEGQTFGGHHYGVQGAGNVLSGLSPWAAHWIAQNLLQKNTYKGQDLTGLTGDDLFKATLANAVGNAQAPTYSLHTGIDQAYLDKLFGPDGALMDVAPGHSFYNKGYNDTSGPAAQAAANPLAGHPMAADHPHYANALKAGFKGTYKQWVAKGKPKK